MSGAWPALPVVRAGAALNQGRWDEPLTLRTCTAPARR